MAIIDGRTSGSPVVLSNAQAGNGASTNVVDRGPSHKFGIMRISTDVGATPTCTYAIEISNDASSWSAATYADISTPNTDVSTTFAISTDTVAQKIVKQPSPWRFLRVTYSANTNVTNTTEYIFLEGKRLP